MRPELYQEVALTRDIPDENLQQGDMATLVDYVPHPARGEEGAVLEIFNAFVAVPLSAIAPLRADQIPAVRLWSGRLPKYGDFESGGVGADPAANDVTERFGVSHQTAMQTLRRLESLTVVKEVTGQQRNQRYLAIEILDALQRELL